MPRRGRLGADRIEVGSRVAKRGFQHDGRRREWTACASVAQRIHERVHRSYAAIEAPRISDSSEWARRLRTMWLIAKSGIRPGRGTASRPAAGEEAPAGADRGLPALNDEKSRCTGARRKRPMARSMPASTVACAADATERQTGDEAGSWLASRFNGVDKSLRTLWRASTRSTWNGEKPGQEPCRRCITH